MVVNFGVGLMTLGWGVSEVIIGGGGTCVGHGFFGLSIHYQFVKLDDL